jgi:hypothetical protein
VKKSNGMSIDRTSSTGAERTEQDFFSIPELAQRWRCSRGSVYNRLRAAGAKVVDFAAAGKRGSKLVPWGVVLEIENKKLKRLC